MPDRAIERLSAAAHYVIAVAGSDLGRTKLNKILWFADCCAWRRHGQTITGLDEYIKLQYGPVPPRLDIALSNLAAEGSIQFDRHHVGTYIRHGYRSMHSPFIGNAIAKSEQTILDEIVEAVAPMTAFDVSELSHDALWHATPYGGRISVRAASVQHTPPDARIMEWARSQRL